MGQEEEEEGNKYVSKQINKHGRASDDSPLCLSQALRKSSVEVWLLAWREQAHSADVGWPSTLQSLTRTSVRQLLVLPFFMEVEEDAEANMVVSWRLWVDPDNE